MPIKYILGSGDKLDLTAVTPLNITGKENRHLRVKSDGSGLEWAAGGLFQADTTIDKTGTADAINQMYNSYKLSFIGSRWDGAQAVNRTFSLRTQIDSASPDNYAFTLQEEAVGFPIFRIARAASVGSYLELACTAGHESILYMGEYGQPWRFAIYARTPGNGTIFDIRNGAFQFVDWDSGLERLTLDTALASFKTDVRFTGVAGPGWLSDFLIKNKGTADATNQQYDSYDLILRNSEWYGGAEVRRDFKLRNKVIDPSSDSYQLQILQGTTQLLDLQTTGGVFYFTLRDASEIQAMYKIAGATKFLFDIRSIVSQLVAYNPMELYGNNTLRLTLDTAGSTFAGNIFGDTNLGLNTTSFGSSADGILAIGNGTAPGSSPADIFQLYSADQAAGNACPHIRTENGAIIKLYKETALTAPDNTAIDATYDATEQAVLDNVRTRLNELETRLKNIGLLN